MRKSELRGWVACVCLLVAPGIALGSDVASAIEREVFPGGTGGNRLEVDVALLAGASEGLGDLRLLTQTGAEVPYLLLEQPTGDRAWKDGKILPTRRTKRRSGFEVDLGELVIVDRIRIGGLPAPFLKRLRLEGGGDRAHWTLLHEQATLFDLPDDELRLLELDFEPGEYRYLRVMWSDRSSARLPLPRAVSARLLEGEPPPAPLRAEMQFSKRTSEPGRSRYRVVLPAAGLPIIGIELGVEPSYLLRKARVSEARLSGSEVRPFALGEGTLRRVVHEDLVAEDMEIEIARPGEAELEIEIEDGDNPPLELTSVMARFASQPWIYFESPDGATLTARYGVTGLESPFYDLEALRQTLGSGGLAKSVMNARFGETQKIVGEPRSLDIEDAVGIGARLDLTGFQTRRALQSGPIGLNALRLDAAVLAGSSGLHDLRIVDRDSAQVPFILETLGEPTVLELEGPVSVPDKAAERQSVYRVTLPFESLPAARLTLSTSARVFERRVQLVREETRNRRDPPIRVSLDQVVWRNSDPDREAPRLSLHVPALNGAELLLLIDEGDNAPLEVGEPRLYLPTYRLRFIRRGDDALWLVYGKHGLGAPRYDLALLAPRVLGAKVPEVELSSDQEEVQAAPLDRTGVIVFWSVLVLVLLVLLVMVAKMIRRGPEEEDG